MMVNFDIWTIYFNPTDYPGKYVVRKFTIQKNHGMFGVSTIKKEQDCFVCDSLELARSHVPDNCNCINRDAQDEPQIVESWI